MFIYKNLNLIVKKIKYDNYKRSLLIHCQRFYTQKFFE